MALITCDVSDLLANQIDVTMRVDNVSLYPDDEGIIQGIDDQIALHYYHFRKFNSSSQYLPTQIGRASLFGGNRLTGNFEVGNYKTSINLEWRNHDGRTEIVLTVPAGYSDPLADPVIEVVEEVRTESIPFDTIIHDDDQLPLGEEEVIIEGIEGEKEIVELVTYTDGVVTDREFISEIIIFEPINHEIRRGTYTPPETFTFNIIALAKDLTHWEYYVNGELYPLEERHNPLSPLDHHYPELEVVEGEAIHVKIVPHDNYNIVYPSHLLSLYDYDITGRHYYYFEDQGDYGELTITASNLLNGLTPYIDFEIKPQPETVELPFSRYYKVSEEVLKEIDQFRFSDLNGDIDYTQYITGLRRYPFNLEAGEVTQILLGDKLLSTTGEHINEFTYRLDLGTIKIPYSIEGEVGFKNVTIELFTPYHNKITLETDEVLGETISLSMIVNLTNGDSTLNVENERNNTIIHSVNAQLGLDIPYSFNQQVNVPSSDGILFNEINECYVEIKTLIPSNSAISYDMQINIIDQYTGFIKTDHNKMISNATQLEQQEIQRLLSGGVYLNGQFNDVGGSIGGSSGNRQ